MKYKVQEELPHEFNDENYSELNMTCIIIVKIFSIEEIKRE